VCTCVFHLGEVFGEDYAKSPSLTEWGSVITLALTIPLASEQLICDWPDTEENQVRRKFCSRYEGYGGLCDCKTTCVLENIRITVMHRLSSASHCNQSQACMFPW